MHLSHSVLLMLGVGLRGKLALLPGVDGSDQRVVVDVLLGALPTNLGVVYWMLLNAKESRLVALAQKPSQA